MLNWENRLARELPLLLELAQRGGGRVLVPACGSGGHVVALAAAGFDVLGFDADEGMVEVTQAKLEAAKGEIAAASGKAEVRHLTMEVASSLPAEFGTAFCLGNALPGLSTEGALLAAIKGIASAVTRGGIFLTQNLNYDLRWQQKVSQFRLLTGETADAEVLLVKMAEYHADYINFHATFLARDKPAGKWEAFPHTSRQIPLFQKLLMETASRAGLGEFTLWGDYAQTRFDPKTSNDLILTARKQK